MMHPGAALWTALQYVPRAGSTRPPLAQQQLRTADMELLVAEQRARNEVKGFWVDTLRAMEEVTKQADEPLCSLLSAAPCFSCKVCRIDGTNWEHCALC
jgi:hypothetical protein